MARGGFNVEILKSAGHVAAPQKSINLALNNENAFFKVASISAFTALQVFANRGLVDTIHYPHKKISCIHHHQPEVDHQQREFPKIIDIMYLIFANFGAPPHYLGL